MRLAGGWRTTHLQERVLLPRFELVGPEDLKTAASLFLVETLVVTLKELEDIVVDDGLEVDLFLIVQILRAKLDL